MIIRSSVEAPLKATLSILPSFQLLSLVSTWMGDHLGTQGVEDFFAYFLHLPQTICDQRMGGVKCFSRVV